MNPLSILHTHWPVYRVVRAGWPRPLDASFSQKGVDRRWNTADFPALYCCCSERVARAIARDLFGFGGVVISDLQPGYRPKLVEIRWQGTVADLASAEGIVAAGFPKDYPTGIDKAQTRTRAAAWLAQGIEGVVCRSASLSRIGLSDWSGSHEAWSEVAIFVSLSATEPELVAEREGIEWLTSS